MTPDNQQEILIREVRMEEKLVASTKLKEMTMTEVEQVQVAEQFDEI